MKANFYKLFKLNAFTRRWLLLTALMVTSVSYTLVAQQYKYGGTVADVGGIPLPGVNVIEKGTTTGAVTDADGKFEFTSANSPITISVSMIGFTTVEMLTQPGTNLQVTLTENIAQLEEIMVVGYGTQKRASISGAIAKLDAAQLTEIPAASVNEAFQGRLAGVNVRSGSGDPGQGPRVVIRGVSTNGNSQPLYVVDGIRTTNIDHIEPYDVESIEVLKDAASAAIYGAEAANGVVLITTKKGTLKPGAKKGDRINYNFQYGLSSPGKVTQPMDAASYADWVNDSDVGVEIPTNSAINTNWMDEIYQTAPSQRHHISFAGGTNKGSYYISGSYLNANGMVGGDQSKYERFTLRTNVDRQVKDWLNVGTNITYMHFNKNQFIEDDEFNGIIPSALMLDPLTPVIYEGALPEYAQNALDEGNALRQDEDGNYYGVSEYVKGEIANPFAKLDIIKDSRKEDKVMGNIFATLGGKSWKGFSFTTRTSVDLANQAFHTWYPSHWFSPDNQNTTPNVRDNTDRWYTWMWENFANYDKVFNEKHHVTAMAGMAAQQYTHKYLTTISGPMFAEDENYAQHGPNEVDGKVSGNLRDDRLVSYFARATYEYDGRYLLNATIRRDGTSLLGTDTRWGSFPSVSVGWIISGEDFWTVDFVEFLKLRASYGGNGMLSSLGPDQFRSLITSSGIQYPRPGGGFYSGAEPELLANPELKWASSEQFDIGVDMWMWNNRLTVGIDYFNKKTKDLLTPGTPPPSVGNYAPFVNAGDVTNKGFEVELGLREYEGAFTWDINLNYTNLDNEVTYLNPLLERVNGASVGTGWTATAFELGYPVWYFRGYQTEGIFQNQSEIDAYIAKYNLTGYNPVPGDPIVSNTDGNNLINADDQTFIGNPHPKHMWGAVFNFKYAGFDLRLFFQGVHGHDVLLGWNRYDRATSNRPQFFYDDRWTGEGSTNEFPRAQQSNPFMYNSDLMVFKGSFVRVRQIQLGYTLPTSIMKDNIDNLRVYISLDDFFTFTNYPGMDPEAGPTRDNRDRDNSLGIDRGMYPTPRKLILGLSLAF